MDRAAIPHNTDTLLNKAMEWRLKATRLNKAMEEDTLPPVTLLLATLLPLLTMAALIAPADSVSGV